ncbi:Esterase/Lipase [Heterobasidion irregulare TC 32-1]|uniref:Esterase/Lipase n=1 Tax=Heterobasidion irregulare (strain TC 32-1) TaxID=747525 RepID=W4JSM1_HETIT|nr:Esterase/Lipase [Heterobasidion irregulare TC 32-1]ETW76562.1 Esterase/Lipase [Heterobasidion irregulare TC 32-1]
MDAALYKKHTTTRGFSYNYFFAAAQPGKSTLIFLHGFPSSSWDWTQEAIFFKARGYGLIVPDMLGYAGTDKPTDPKVYVGSGLAKDIVDIMDHEGVEKAVAIGHDWGCIPASRLANYYNDRFLAFAFFAVGYIPPNPVFDPAAQAAKTRELAGRDLFAYWEFFSEEGADKTIEKNFDSFFSLFFPNPPELWKDHVTVIGGAKAWVEGNKQSPAPAYIKPEDKEHYKKLLLEGGLAAPLCWYKAITGGFTSEDDKLIPLSSYGFQQPAFFGAALKDMIALPVIGKATVQAAAKGPVTIREFDGDHWIVLSHADEINRELSAWLEEHSI